MSTFRSPPARRPWRATLSIAVLLASCGGGGGGGDAPPAPEPVSAPVAISQQNVLVVAAYADDAALRLGNVAVSQLWEVSRALLQAFPASPPEGTTVPCPGGGTVTGGSARPGEVVLVADGCAAGSATVTGGLRLLPVSNTHSSDSGELEQLTGITARELTMAPTGDGATLQVSGDLSTEYRSVSRFEHALLYGATLTVARLAPGGARSYTLRNYSYRKDRALMQRSLGVTATLDMADARLGPGRCSLAVQADLQMFSLTTSGTIAASGQASSLTLTPTAPGSVSGESLYELAADTNGDGAVDLTPDPAWSTALEGML